MKPISESFVNQHLRRAAGTLAPHKAEELWEQPVEQATGGEWYLDGTRPKKRHTGRTIGVFSSLAACLAVCFLSLYLVNYRVDATVYLDVNPSVTLEVNCNEKVIRAQANNPDGAVILADMDLKHTDLNVAVNAVIGSMVRHGYLTEAKDTVLLSVSSGSEEKTVSLRARLSGEINGCLTSLVGSGTVFDQAVEPDGELEDLAEEHGITPGKAALIRQVAEAHPELDFDTLAGLSIKELTGYLAASGTDSRDSAGQAGASFDGADREDGFEPDDAFDGADSPDGPDAGEAGGIDSADMEEPYNPDAPDFPEGSGEDAEDTAEDEQEDDAEDAAEDEREDDAPEPGEEEAGESEDDG